MIRDKIRLENNPDRFMIRHQRTRIESYTSLYEVLGGINGKSILIDPIVEDAVIYEGISMLEPGLPPN